MAQSFRDFDEYVVAGRVTERVVDLLEVVDVQEHDRGRFGPASVGVSSSGSAFDEVTTVRQVGQLVVKCFMFAAARFALELVDETAVLERDARVAAECAQKSAVGSVEGSDVAEPVAEQEDANQAAFAAERRGDEVRTFVLREQRASAGITIVTADDECRYAADQPTPERISNRYDVVRVDGRFVGAVERDAGSAAAAVGGKEPQFGPVSFQASASLAECSKRDFLKCDGLAERSRVLLQHFEFGVSLPQ